MTFPDISSVLIPCLRPVGKKGAAKGRRESDGLQGSSHPIGVDEGRGGEVVDGRGHILPILPILRSTKFVWKYAFSREGLLQRVGLT